MASTLKVATTQCPPEVIAAIHGPKSPTKNADLEASMKRWWRCYSERKSANPTEEYAANSLIYDPTHLPHTPVTPTADRQ